MSPKVEGGKSKAKKDPNAPKKPASSFMMYCSEHRDKIKSANPSIKVQDIQRRLGEMWAKATDAEKKKFEEKAAKDREVYQKKMEEYRKSPEFAAHKATGGKVAAAGKRAKKDKNAPKKGMSAFMLFSQAHREATKTANPTATFGEMGKILGEKWKNASESEKKKFQIEAEKDKARYEAEMKNYQAGEGSVASSSKKAKTVSKKKKEESESENEEVEEEDDAEEVESEEEEEEEEEDDE